MTHTGDKQTDTRLKKHIRDYVESTLRANMLNVRKTAKVLGIGRTTLWRWLREWKKEGNNT